MQVNDASISQHHAIIKKSPQLNEFILIEDQSKFGVLKLIQEPLKLSLDHEISICIGCIVLVFKLEDRNKECNIASAIKPEEV